MRPPKNIFDSMASAMWSRIATAPSGRYDEVRPLAIVIRSGHDVPVVDGEPAPGPPEAGHDLVGHHQDPVAVADLAHALEVAVGRDQDAVRATMVSRNTAAMELGPSYLMTSSRPCSASPTGRGSFSPQRCVSG